jgi:uncharacterized protein
MTMLANLYRRIVLKGAAWLMAFLLAMSVFFALQVPNIKLDASSDSLVLEGDNALEVYRQTTKTYGSDEFLLVTFKPHGELLADENLATIARLRDELAALEQVTSVVSILDVPLLQSPPLSLTDLSSDIHTLSDPSVDKQLAAEELRTSPIYKDLLSNADGDITMLQVNLFNDPRYNELLNARDDLRALEHQRPLSPDEKAALAKASQVFKDYVAQANITRDQYIAEIRAILTTYRGETEIFLGGVPMIAADMIDFIRSDLNIFGVGLFLFIVVLLAVIFHSARWVVLPLLTCGVTIVTMLGYLALVDWRMTVISSNFVALLLIVTLSICIHLVVRYRELLVERPEDDNEALVFETIRYMAKPCLYTALTTIVAFASLVVSGIRPVIDFGWMMTIGISLALIMAFLVLPAGMMLWGKGGAGYAGGGAPGVTVYFARMTDHLKNGVLWIALLLAGISVYGISQLQVENRFIDYFDESTEIYQGMETIDREFGGTIPLDILIKTQPLDAAGEDLFAVEGAADSFADDPFASSDPFAESDPFADGDAPASFEQSPWFTVDGLSKIEAVHDYLESLPETGKVLSLGTFYKVVRGLAGNVDDIQLAVLQNSLPSDIDSFLVAPYLDAENHQARISLRVKETSHSLRRNQFLIDLRHHLVNDMGIADEDLQFTGMLVLYNNMLQSLFRSQILTLGFVFVAIVAMFLVLFRSLSLSLIAITPNILAAGMVLGFMGLLGMPLDLMTITIAAICVGIGVDDTIHYIHRFKTEFAKDGHYRDTMFRSHASIGRAMYYTSATIVIGFSVLTLSNFTPSIYFGILTGVAMLAALLGAMTLLPRLIVWIKPFGPGSAG